MASRGAIVDLDGTVYRGGSLLPGARTGLDTLCEAGHAIQFVSNNPAKSPAEFADRLTDLGIAADPDEIVSAAGDRKSVV